MGTRNSAGTKALVPCRVQAKEKSLLWVSFVGCRNCQLKKKKYNIAIGFIGGK